MSDCRFGFLPINYPDPDPDSESKFPVSDEIRIRVFKYYIVYN